MNARAMSILVLASLAAGTPALAKPAEQSKAQGTTQLKQALNEVAATANGQGPPADRASKSQGAAHANPRAILRVCSKDTPAAERAAICRTGVSPD
jgi:hypothetical protein